MSANIHNRCGQGFSFDTCPHNKHIQGKFNMRYNVISIILIICSFSSVCYAADISVEELIHGVNQARMTIQSGEIQTATVIETPATKNEEEIAETIKTDAEEELKTFVAHDGVDAKTFKKDYLIPTL